MLKKTLIFILLCFVVSLVYFFTAKLYKIEINADIVIDKSETIQNPKDFKLYYALRHKNDSFNEKYSTYADVKSENNQILSFEISKLRSKNKMTSLRLDFDEIHKKYTLRGISVNGNALALEKFHSHNVDLTVLQPNGLELTVTGDDPYIYIYNDIKEKPVIDQSELSVLWCFLLVSAVVYFVLVSGLMRWLVNKYTFILLVPGIFLFVFIYTNRWDLLLPFAVEWMFCVLLLELLGRAKLSRLFLSVIILAVYGCQIASLVSSGNYVVVLTLENLSEYNSVGMDVIRLSFAILALFLLIAIYVPLLNFCRNLGRYRWLILLGLGCFVAVFNLCDYKSPFYDNIKTCITFAKLKFVSYDQGIMEEQKLLYGKNNIVFDKSPLNGGLDLKNKNVIVVFTEGFSANLLSMNNGLENLTPNIDAFAKKSLYLENYFNHTAATFRGIRGQLTSSFQMTGGYYNDNSGIGQVSKEELNKRYESTVVGIPQLLKDNGYHSYFVVSHKSDHNLVYMLQTLSFDKVYAADNYAKNTSGEQLSDQQVFSFVNELLESGELKEPFFLGIYQEGTHLGVDSPDKKYRNGDNILLNAVNNYDDALSKLLRKFEDLDFARKNAIVITADHATYPSSQYVSTVDQNALYFVNRVPFILYTYGISPRVLDVKGQNSLALAPTLLHLLGITEGYNYFLGCSVFDSRCNSDFKFVEAIYPDIWLSDNAELKKCHDSKLDRQLSRLYNLTDRL